MTGQGIRTEGSVDPAAIETRGARMAVVSHRRGPVIGYRLLAWVLATLLLVLLSRGALAPVAVRLLGLSVVYLPLLLLGGAALEPAQYPEMLVVMIAAPLLAALTLAALRDYRALAVAVGGHRRRLRARRDRSARRSRPSRCSARTPASASASTGSATSSRRCSRC